MSINYTPRTWVTGEVVTAAEMNTEIKTAFTNLQAAWTAYTPTATNWTVGNGAISGRYNQVGKTVAVRIVVGGGTTSTYTASAMQVGLPFAAFATLNQTMPLRLSSSAGQFAASVTIVAGSSQASCEAPASTANCGLVSMSSASPNPGTNGSFIIEGTYEIA